MSDAKATCIRRRLEPYYDPYRLPDVFVHRLMQTLQQRNLAANLERLLTATESLLARLLEVWRSRGINGFPLRLGPYALLHLVEPVSDFLADDGDFCFCIGIGAFGTLSLKFFVNGKVRSSTVNKSDYAEIWSTDFYNRLLGKSRDYSSRLFTKGVLYDLEKCIYVYKSLEDIVGEITLPAHDRSVSIPIRSMRRLSMEKMDNSDADQERDRMRSRSSSMDTEFSKRRDEEKEYQEKVLDLCERLSQPLCDDSTARKNWKYLAHDLLDWDFTECKSFQKKNGEDAAGQMLAEFVKSQQSHKLHSQKWIYVRIIRGVKNIGRQDILHDLSVTSLSTPTEESTPDKRGLYTRGQLQVPRKCSEPNSNDDVLLGSGKSGQPMNLFAEDIKSASKASLPQEEDEIGNEKNVLIKSTTFDLTDLRLYASEDHGAGHDGQPIPIDQFRQYKQVHPPKQHNPPNIGSQSFPGQRLSDTHRVAADTESHTEEVSFLPANLPGNGSGYPETGQAVLLATMGVPQRLPSGSQQHRESTPYPDPCQMAALAVSENLPHQAEHNGTGPGYPSPKEAVEAAIDEADRTHHSLKEEGADGHDTSSAGYHSTHSVPA